MTVFDMDYAEEPEPPGGWERDPHCGTCNDRRTVTYDTNDMVVDWSRDDEFAQPFRDDGCPDCDPPAWMIAELDRLNAVGEAEFAARVARGEVSADDDPDDPWGPF